MLKTYLRGLLSLGVAPSWNNLNGLAGSLLSVAAAAIWPFDVGATASWLNAIASLIIYSCAAWIILYAASAAFVAPYRLWLRDRSNPSQAGLEIVFDENDPFFVRDTKGLYIGTVGVRRWHVGVKNLSMTTNIDDVSLRAHEGRFVRHTIAATHAPDERVPVILRCPTLAPGATDHIVLLSLSGHLRGSAQDLLNHRHTFVLEARGRDVPIVTVEFEFLPGDPPIIRRMQHKL